MNKKVLLSFFALLLVSTIIFGGPRKDAVEKRNTGTYNGFTQGAPQLNPIFFDNFGPESFENVSFPPTGWARFSPINNVIMWSRITQGMLPEGWNPGFGLETTVPPGGGTAVAMITYDGSGPLQNDVWLVTPRIYNVNLTDSLVFWLSKKAAYIDNLDVKISKTTNNNAAAFSITAALYTFGANNNDSAWVRKSIYLGSVAGLVNGDSIYVGFREHVTNNLNDGGIINIDLVAGVGSLVVSTGNQSSLVADRFGLAQNYPNPFNPSTTIYYNMPKSGNVKIKVYDVLGNEISTLVNEYKIGGTHQIVFNAGWLASGIYFYRMEADGFTDVKRMTLIK